MAQQRVDTAELIDGLVEAFGAAERPDSSSEPVRYMRWTKLAGVVSTLPMRPNAELGSALRQVVDLSGSLGDEQTQAYAACVARALGHELAIAA